MKSKITMLTLALTVLATTSAHGMFRITPITAATLAKGFEYHSRKMNQENKQAKHMLDTLKIARNRHNEKNADLKRTVADFSVEMQDKREFKKFVTKKTHEHTEIYKEFLDIYNSFED